MKLTEEDEAFRILWSVTQYLIWIHNDSEARRIVSHIRISVRTSDLHDLLYDYGNKWEFLYKNSIFLSDAAELGV